MFQEDFQLRMSSGYETREHYRRAEDSESKYKICLTDILNGKDTRTTLMIKNIPNKYTQPMLLQKIDTSHKMQYNLFYLPMDTKVHSLVQYRTIVM
jgi:hypothetical protein